MRNLLKALAFLLFLFGLVALLGTLFHERLQSIGTAFIDRFGVAGMALGSFLADAIHFPVPPQFYMLASIAAKVPQGAALAAICAGSVLGDVVAVFVGRALSRVGWIHRKLQPSGRIVHQFVEKHGVLAAALGGASPVSFAAQCNLAGMYRMPARFIVLLLVLRVPRMLVLYAVFAAGWRAST